MNHVEAARGYYEAIDDHTYDELREILAPQFRQFRPDRTLEGRERFVTFMAEERPRTDTIHAIDTVFVEAEDGEGAEPDESGTGRDDRAEAGPEATEVAVRGRLFGDDGEELFAFVDVFRFEDGAVVELRTYTQ